MAPVNSTSDTPQQDTVDFDPRHTEVDFARICADMATVFGDRYELGNKLGQGGCGTVFKGFDRRLKRAVAVKIAKSDRNGASEADRLVQEAQQIAQMRHPGIVTVHDVGIAGQWCFIVSELLEGPNLSDWRKAKQPLWHEAVEIAAAMADALAHAHARSIVHRDIKPSNVILLDGSRPVLVDFGIALSDATAASSRGRIAGTPHYMSPEQASGLAHRPDGRTDIYSLGVTLYELLCGRPPFRGDNPFVIMQQVLEDDPQPLRQLRPDLPVEVEQTVLRAMAKFPSARYTTDDDFAVDLRKSLCRYERTLRLEQQIPAADDFSINVASQPDNGLSAGRGENIEQTGIMKISAYELGRSLGKGTVAETFMASDGSRLAVVKKLNPDLARNDEFVKRFLDVSNFSNQITNKRLFAKVISHLKIEADVYLIREFVDGTSLAQLHADKQLASLDMRKLAAHLCEAIRMLHLRSIVHGGIHPGNLLVQGAILRLSDFSYSRAQLTRKVDSSYPLHAVRYLAPEQWRGESASLKSDIYSAAMVIALLTKQREMLEGKSYGEIREQALSDLQIDNPVLAEALQRQPEKRPDVGPFAKNLDEWFEAQKNLPPKTEEPSVQSQPARAQPAQSQPAQTLPRQTQAPRQPPPAGVLQAMMDLKEGTDLLALNHRQPWRLPRTGASQQWPILFKNAGPGVLRLNLRCIGNGIRLTPTASLRIKPGNIGYAIVALDAPECEWARLDVSWDGQKPSQRVQIRMHCPV